MSKAMVRVVRAFGHIVRCGRERYPSISRVELAELAHVEREVVRDVEHGEAYKFPQEPLGRIVAVLFAVERLEKDEKRRAEQFLLVFTRPRQAPVRLNHRWRYAVRQH